MPRRLTGIRQILTALILTATARAVAQSSPVPAAGVRQASLVFDRVTVVDIKRGKPLQDQRVVVEGNRIRAVGAVDRVPMPAGAKVIDARGRYLIPGLWDMHVHVNERATLYGEFIVQGITGVREMSDGNAAGADSFPQWQLEILAGHRAGPRTAGRPLHLHQGKPGNASGENRTDGGALLVVLLTTDGAPLPQLAVDSLPDSVRRAVWHSGTLEVTTPAEARRAVALMKAAGVPWIKLYGADMDASMAPDVFFAAAAEARRQGIAFAGHRPFSVSPMAASDSGMRSFEHVPFGFLPPCTAAVWQALPSGDTADLGYKVLHVMAALDPAELAWHDSSSAAIERGCQVLARRLARNDTWLVPTLVVTEGRGREKDPNTPEEPLPPLVAEWARLRKAFVAKLYRLGAPVMAGTDVGYGGLPPRLLHDELADYVEGGLTPLEALRTATLNPARYLHATDSLGSIEAGKLADLVLLDADPLADIHNTTKIAAVVANGHYYDRAALDSIASAAEGAHQTRPRKR